LAARMKKPAIVSPKAAKKKVTGHFDLSDPALVLAQLESDLNLTSYSDGLSLYVYDSTELRSMVGNMRNASIRSLTDFLAKASLSDPRFPIRGDGRDGTFYISAPPIYVDIVTSAATYLNHVSLDSTVCPRDRR
jgi:type III secretion system outer membrane ring protein